MHARMNEKRIRKLDPAARARRDCSRSRATADAPLALVSWGSVAGVGARGAGAARTRSGVQVKLLVPTLLYPVAAGDLRGVLRVGARRPRRRAVAPGAAVSAAAHVRRRARGRRVARAQRREPVHAERDRGAPSARSRDGAAAVARARSSSRERMSDERSATMRSRITAKDYKSELKPIWCPGCGDFGVRAGDLSRARAHRPRRRTRSRSSPGIGCSSRIPGYTTAYGFNSVHGRALPIAQGIKLAQPRAAGARRRRRRRRLLDRRRARAARHPPQPRPHLHRDGQPDLRADEGAALADLAARAEHRVVGRTAASRIR